MDTLGKKLALSVFVGLVIVGIANVLAETTAWSRLIIDAINHLGIIIVGIAAVEVVWTWAGGSPTELDLRRLMGLNEELNAKMKEDVASLSKTSGDIKETSDRIEDSVHRMTTIVTAANRTGLANVGAEQEALGYIPSVFAKMVKDARDSVALCGYTLNFVYSHDSVFEALTAAANRGIRVRVLLPAPESKFLVAMFNDRFEESIRQGSRSLIKRIVDHKSN